MTSTSRSTTPSASRVTRTTTATMSSASAASPATNARTAPSTTPARSSGSPTTSPKSAGTDRRELEADPRPSMTIPLDDRALHAELRESDARDGDHLHPDVQRVRAVFSSFAIFTCWDELPLGTDGPIAFIFSSLGTPSRSRGCASTAQTPSGFLMVGEEFRRITRRADDGRPVSPPRNYHVEGAHAAADMITIPADQVGEGAGSARDRIHK